MEMTQSYDGERTRGASIGATIVGGFGAAWLAMGMVSAGVATRTALAWVLPVFVLIACLGVVARRRLPPSAARNSVEKERMTRVFFAVNVAQWLAIFGTANLLRNLGLAAWTIPAIVLIVGAHFLPLARLYRTRAHLVTGVAMMLCAAVAIVLPGPVRDTVECVTAGLILWGSAAHALHCAFRHLPSKPTHSRGIGHARQTRSRA